LRGALRPIARAAVLVRVGNDDDLLALFDETIQNGKRANGTRRTPKSLGTFAAGTP
jgi:hypothetical protein